MTRDFAVNATKSILRAVDELHSVVMTTGGMDPSERADYEKSLGILIGEIEVRLLQPIYQQYPDLDDIADLR